MTGKSTTEDKVNEKKGLETEIEVVIEVDGNDASDLSEVQTFYDDNLSDMAVIEESLLKNCSFKVKGKMSVVEILSLYETCTEYGNEVEEVGGEIYITLH